MAITSAVVGIGTTIAGGAVAAAGSAKESAAQEGMYNYQAAIADANRKIALQNKDIAEVTGEQQAAQFGERAAAQMGQIRSRQAASGIDIGTGSAQEVQRSQQALTRQDLGTIRANTAQRAYGFDVEAMQAGAQAGLYRQASADVASAAPLKIAGSLLSSAGSVSSKWLQGSQAGALPSSIPWSG